MPMKNHPTLWKRVTRHCFMRSLTEAGVTVRLMVVEHPDGWEGRVDGETRFGGVTLQSAKKRLMEEGRTELEIAIAEREVHEALDKAS